MSEKFGDEVRFRRGGQSFLNICNIVFCEKIIYIFIQNE